jgi:hypothetical protein
MLNDEKFRRLFLEQGKKMKAMGVVDAFCEKNSRNALKKKPKVQSASWSSQYLRRVANE